MASRSSESIGVSGNPQDTQCALRCRRGTSEGGILFQLQIHVLTYEMHSYSWRNCMKFLSSRVVLILLSSLLFKSEMPAQTLDSAGITKEIGPAVVSIRGTTDKGDLIGTGFIISTDGKIATNLHVIA